MRVSDIVDAVTDLADQRDAASSQVKRLVADLHAIAEALGCKNSQVDVLAEVRRLKEFEERECATCCQ